MSTRSDPDREDELSVEESGRSELASEEVERSGIQIDGYKITTWFEPAETGEPAPKSLEELKAAVHTKLFSIAFNALGLVDDCLIGSRKMVRGLSKMPPEQKRTAELAHAKADRKEARLQEEAATGKLPPPSPSDAADRVVEALRILQAEGVPVMIQQLNDGRQAIVIVKPDALPNVAALIRKALPSPIKPDVQAKGRTSRSAGESVEPGEPKNVRRGKSRSSKSRPKAPPESEGSTEPTS